MFSGPTRYYFFIGGHRHYYGTRNHGQCNGDCDQSVYMTKLTATVNVGNGFNPELTETFRTKLVSAVPGYGVTSPMVTVNSVGTVNSDGYYPVTFSIFVVDGASASQLANYISTGTCSASSTFQTTFSPFTMDNTHGGTSPCNSAGQLTVHQQLIRANPQADGGALTSLPSAALLLASAAAAMFSQM